jgi:hypothetical protein
MLRPAVCICALFLTSSTVAWCGTVNIGILSFDVSSPPSGGTPGVNVFNISNFTGDPISGGFALEPDFPVFTSLILMGATLTLNDGASLPVIYNLGPIDPGPFSPPGTIQFPDTTAFTSAIFAATLNETTLLLPDGYVFVTDTTSVIATFVPSGPTLTAGSDFAIISLTGTLQAPVPEPQSALLTLSAIGLLAAISKKIRRA